MQATVPPNEGWGTIVLMMLGMQTESLQYPENAGATENQLFMCDAVPAGPTGKIGKKDGQERPTSEQRVQSKPVILPKTYGNMMFHKIILTSHAWVEIRLHLRVLCARRVRPSARHR